MSQTIHACPCCDAWLDVPGIHVISVDHDDHVVVVTVVGDHAERGCPACGVLATVHGRRTETLIDAPAMGRPMRLRWVKHRCVCREHLCDQQTFTETDQRIAPASHLLTRRATRWRSSSCAASTPQSEWAGPPTRHRVEDVVARHEASSADS